MWLHASPKHPPQVLHHDTRIHAELAAVKLVGEPLQLRLQAAAQRPPALPVGVQGEVHEVAGADWAVMTHEPAEKRERCEKLGLSHQITASREGGLRKEETKTESQSQMQKELE